MITKRVLHIFIHSIKYSYLCLTISVLIPINGKPQYYDTATLTLAGQNLTDYSCIMNKPQIEKSSYLTQLIKFDENNRIVFDPDANVSADRIFAKDGELVNNSPTYSLPYDVDTEFFKIGFYDMCYYFRSINFNQDYDEDYRLPMPLLLENSHDFYNLKQLTIQEILFMKEIESFDNDIDNVHPFDINMTRMNNLFKFADFLQIKRLIAIIASRHASLMKNMNKQQMIQWLIDIKYSNLNAKKQIVSQNNHMYNNQCNKDANVNVKMIPLLQQTHILNNDDNIDNANELIESNVVISMTILSFLSCYDIHTFASISDLFYEIASDAKAIELNIDPMIKILTNNNDATCLSLNNQELSFYKSFLTLPQYKWTENQNDIYNKLQTMTHKTEFATFDGMLVFDTLSLVDDKHKIIELRCVISSDGNLIVINSQLHHNSFSSFSFKFGKISEHINDFAQIRNIENVKIVAHSSLFLSSFNDLIGINDINNIKSIAIFQHSFSVINFEEIYDISNQLEYLRIDKPHIQAQQDTTPTTLVKNIQFLSKLKSLKNLSLSENNLDSFNFDALKGLTNLELLIIDYNMLDYKLDSQCLDFAFLNSVPNLKELHLRNNNKTFECITNFIAIQSHPSLLFLHLEGNTISSLDLNAFRGTNIQKICLNRNQLSNVTDHDGDTCLDFNSFKNMYQLQELYLQDNQIQCIINLESIQQHTQLTSLSLDANILLSSTIDFTKFDESMPKMNSLRYINFSNMNLKYASTSDSTMCFDLQFLKFIPNVEELHLSYNAIKCIDNVSILKESDISLKYLDLNNNDLVSFDFTELKDSNTAEIDLRYNNLSFKSLKHFDNDTLSQINPSDGVKICIIDGNDEKIGEQVATLESKQVVIV